MHIKTLHAFVGLSSQHWGNDLEASLVEGEEVVLEQGLSVPTGSHLCSFSFLSGLCVELSRQNYWILSILHCLPCQITQHNIFFFSPPLGFLGNN